jgi:PPOX class probable FMN-dependent enzyme
MSSPSPFGNTIGSVEHLREIYRAPTGLAITKERSALDPASMRFIERSRFAVVGTFDTEGRADVSPRGGPIGYVRLVDANHLVIADFGGNNRLDTLQNVVLTGRIAAVFVVPGQNETVRVNGAAWITTEPDLLAGFDLPRVPKSAIGVRVEATYIHCAKAFQRSGMWDPEVWADLSDAPDASDILVCQGLVEMGADVMRGHLAEGYAQALAFEAGRD